MDALNRRYLIIRGETTAMRIALPIHGTFALGRDASADIFVDEARIEPAHLRIHCDGTLRLEILAQVETARGRLAPGQTIDGEDGLVMRIDQTELEIVSRAPQPHEDRGHEAVFIVESEAMKEVERLARQVAPTDAPVLILGETGTGKDVIAELIHRNAEESTNSNAPPRRLTCAGLTEATLEEAIRNHRGGTLILDEVFGLSEQLQLALRNYLEGAPEVRFIATSNHDLEAAAKTGKFRSDLFFRLNAVSIKLPPLRTRKVDIVPLAEHFARRVGGQPLDSAVKKRLRAYPWPGNVRELENAIGRAVLLSATKHIAPHDLPNPEGPLSADTGELPSGGLREELAALEKKRILAAIEKFSTQAEAAKALGVPLRTFRNRLDALGIPRTKKG